MEISKLYNVNVYVDATNDLIGRAGELTLPEITAAQDEHQALGMIGKIMLPTGLEQLEGKIKWSGFYADAVKFGANPFVAHKVQVRGNVQTFGADGLQTEVPLVVLMTVKFKKHPLGVMAAQTQAETEQEFSCTYVKVTLDGQELVEIDVLENVWKVGGVDILAAYRKNLGG